MTIYRKKYAIAVSAFLTKILKITTITYKMRMLITVLEKSFAFAIKGI